MPVPETDVLKPKDPSLTDDNDWEEFHLNNVEVRDADGQLVSLLDADAVSPVTVTGRLEPVSPDQAHLLVQSQPRATQIEIENVTRFAYGQYEDGESAIWAAGEAGWFKVTPARAYRDTYDAMVDAITILYFLADVYREGEADGNAKAIFKEYAAQNGLNAKQAADAIYTHREFLILSMLRGKELEDPAWNYTDIFLHLKSTFPEDFSAMERKNAGKVGPDKRKRPRATPGSQRAKSASQGAESADEPAPTKSSSAVPRKDDNWWEAKVLWEMMQKAHIQGLIAPENMTATEFGKIMVRKYEVDDEDLAADYIKAHASNLRFMMAGKRRKAIEWRSQPIYAELAQVRLSAPALQRASELQVRRRKEPLPDPETEPSQNESDSSSTEVLPPVRRRGRKARASILRPKGSGYARKSGKGMTRSGKSYARSSGDEDDDSDNSGLKSPPKRKVETDSENTRRKRTASRSQAQEISPPDSDDERKEMLPLRWKTPRSNHTTRTATPGFVPTLVSDTTQSIEANSPGDIWRCTHDGCVHKVYGASTDESQALIAEHLDEHDAKRKEAVELARSEELRSNLPVSNLIKRIREMADTQSNMQLMGLVGNGASNGGDAFPQPIRRLY